MSLLTVEDNDEREKLMHVDNELAAKRRRILLVNSVFFIKDLS